VAGFASATGHCFTFTFNYVALAADAGLRIRIFNLAIKLISCILYVVRVMLDDAGTGDDTDPGSSSRSAV